LTKPKKSQKLRPDEENIESVDVEKEVNELIYKM
jgi:hypothetical protein